MKTFAILFTLFYFLNALAVAPYGFKGQQQSQTLYSNVLQAQNNLVTNMGGINALLETGNKNILINPSFEHATFSTGWTNSAGTFTQDTVVEIDGLKAAKLVLSSQTMSLSQSSTLYASQFADGIQGLASVRVKSDVALKVCSIQAGTVSTSNCVDVVANNKWGLYKVPFILGATSNGISIASTGAVSGTVYIDDAFLGAVDLSADIDSSKIAGESYFAGTTGCTWSRTSSTVGGFTATALCPGPTISYSSIGQWQTTDSDLPRQTINNLPAGTYKAKFIAPMDTSNGNTSAFAINDGTTTCEAVNSNNTLGTVIGQMVECTFVYNSSGNRTFELYGASASNSIRIQNTQSSAPRISTKFILEYFGNSSVYSSTNANTEWTPFTMSIQAITTAPTKGSGGYENAEWRRVGSMMEIRYQYYQTVAGTAGSGVYLFPLPNISQCGGQCEVDQNKLIAAKLFTGETPIGYAITSSATSSTSARATPILVSPNLSATWGYKAFALTYARTVLEDQSPVGSSFYPLSTTQMTYDVFVQVPIKNWTDSNIIIGQFNGLESCTNTLECTDSFTAKISAAGVTSRENYDWVSGNASVPSTGTYNLTLNSGIFSVLPNCVATSEAPVGSPSVSYVTVNSTTSISVFQRNTSNALQTSDFYITCQKQGVDYIGKTAKAVAGDQNVSTPGAIKSTICSWTQTSGTVSDQRGGCVASGSVSGTTQSVTFTSNYWVNRPNCFCTAAQNDAFGDRICKTVGFPTTSALTVQTSAGTSSALYPVSVFCHGERQ